MTVVPFVMVGHCHSLEEGFLDILADDLVHLLADDEDFAGEDKIASAI